MGKITAYRAIIEVPVMMLYSRIRTKFRVSTMMKGSLILFTIKSLAFCYAHSIPALYLALILQPFSYCIFLLALVDYVALVIPPEDSTKGQALCFGATTAGAIICSFILGRLYDLFPTSTVLLIAFGICLVGVLIAFFSIRKTDE